MEKASPGLLDPRPAPPPRFCRGSGVGTGLVACLWWWTAIGGLTAAVYADPALPSPYQQALAFFNQHRDAQALARLEQVPTETNSARADALNLRGAIYLRQGRFEQARQAFAGAVAADPGLWAARYNEAEVTFREKRYAASHEQWDALLDHTSRVFHADARRFLEYKLLLTDLCAGQEQSTLDFLAAHRSDPSPPLAWYYLNAALEQRHGHRQKAGEFLAQADTRSASGNREIYAESLDRVTELRSSAHPSAATEWAGMHRASRRLSEPGASDVARVDSMFSRQHPQTARVDAPSQPASTANVAVVQLLPDRSKDGSDPSPAAVETSAVPAFRLGEPPASADAPDAGSIPPVNPGLFPEGNRTASPVASGPGVLAKPRRPRTSATPTPTPDASPDATTANQGGPGTATASASPATTADSAAPTPTPPPASPEFAQQYEAAYAKFLQKDYPGCLALLDEADKIQPKRPESATLRKQVFKQDYEAAYLAFRKFDYPTALAKLDEADQAEPNYPDALNLRGLVYSRQRVYDKAEAMFKKAVETDPTLWAAKFNYAELPFNRGDYTTARGRFEDLLAETDATKRPREAELTEYKVFLTLLMEGKTDQARSFMDRFNFSGATPAKYFCNAAMNFRAGTVDKAEDWINSAKKEYPAQLVSIFLESFYRLGWMADPNTPAVGTSLAAASATASPAVPTAVEFAAASPAPSLTPAKVAAIPASPAPGPTASPTLLAAASPALAPGPASPAGSASPSPTATIRPAAPATPTPSSVVAVTVITPVPRIPVTPAASAAPEEVTALRTPSAAELKKGQSTASDDFLRWCLVGGVLLYALYAVAKVLTAVSRRKARRSTRALARGEGRTVAEPEEVNTSL